MFDLCNSLSMAQCKAGFKDPWIYSPPYGFSFATHMLNLGSNIHVIKTLLGHSKIETTMIYLHLEAHTRHCITSRYLTLPSEQNKYQPPKRQCKSQLRSNSYFNKIFNHPSTAGYNKYSQNVLSKLRRCHHGDRSSCYKCNNSACGHVHHQYHSCGNRPVQIAEVLNEINGSKHRMSELLPTKYYHIVFTVPHQLHSIVSL
ncbi:MAG: transposase zinc-binding domain-containing protein [Saprospiraceae bacterium]|nr:transposase zinc-binding domain-containing protein [Saprospiraceae bacterium]